MKNFSNAADSFDKAAMYDPTYVEAWISKAMSLGALERYDEAKLRWIKH
jgi:Flp pilus assembly protein TadD